jgi:hypothetical protein
MDRMMPQGKIVAVFMFLLAGAAGAQTPAVSGTFVSMLGNDTIAVERYTRTATKLEGDIVRRAPRVQLVHYVADLANGRFRGMSIATRRVDTDPAIAPIFSMVALFADSTATVEVHRNGRADTTGTGRRSFSGPVGPAIPGSPPSLGLYEQYLAFNAPHPRDSVVVSLIGAAAGPASTITLLRRGRDSIAFTSSFFPGWTEVATVDAAGRIQSLDASATTVKAITRRATNLDFDALAKAWAAYEAQHGVIGQMSAPDTLRATVGTANVQIAYSRPLKRGRTIFGNVVPWNQVWRTGANAATEFSTSADLVFGNTIVPAGKYTVWSIPTQTGAKLIINTQTGQWGTDYDASRDLARLDLTQTMLPAPVDRFTFAIAPRGSNGVMSFSWDDREYSIPFRVK